MNLLEWMEKTLTDNEELRKKIIDSYDSRLKDIFTEDEILAILDALKQPTWTPSGFWQPITANQDQIRVYNRDNIFKFHPESENNTVISSNILNGD